MSVIEAHPSSPLGSERTAAAIARAFEDAPASDRELAYILSVAVSCTAEELREAHRAVWPERDVSESSVEAFLAWAFIEHVGERWRISQPFDITLATQFRSADPARNGIHAGGRHAGPRP